MVQVHLRFKCYVDPPNNIIVDLPCPLNPHTNVKAGGRTRSEKITIVALVVGIKNKNCGAGGWGKH